MAARTAARSSSVASFLPGDDFFFFEALLSRGDAAASLLPLSTSARFLDLPDEDALGGGADSFPSSSHSSSARLCHFASPSSYRIKWICLPSSSVTFLTVPLNHFFSPTQNTRSLESIAGPIPSILIELPARE